MKKFFLVFISFLSCMLYIENIQLMFIILYFVSNKRNSNILIILGMLLYNFLFDPISIIKNLICLSIISFIKEIIMYIFKIKKIKIVPIIWLSLIAYILIVFKVEKINVYPIDIINIFVIITIAYVIYWCIIFLVKKKEVGYK